MSKLPKLGVFQRNDKNAKSDWYQYCVNEQIPHVKIETRSQLADVEFDYVTFDYAAIDETLKSNRLKIRDLALEIFDRYKSPQSKVISTGWGVVRINDLPIENAEPAGEALFNGISEILRQREQ